MTPVLSFVMTKGQLMVRASAVLPQMPALARLRDAYALKRESAEPST
jgi:hypothetical protein